MRPLPRQTLASSLRFTLGTVSPSVWYSSCVALPLVRPPTRPLARPPSKPPALRLTVWDAGSELFTGVLPNMYQPPAGFCFDILCDDEPIMDDRRLHDYNVDRKVEGRVCAALCADSTAAPGLSLAVLLTPLIIPDIPLSPVVYSICTTTGLYKQSFIQPLPFLL